MTATLNAAPPVTAPTGGATPSAEGIAGGYRFARSALVVTSLGAPIGQGNIRGLGKGRPAVHQNAKLLLPWRDNITWRAVDQIGKTGGGYPLTGPVAVTLAFTVKKPLAAPKRRRTYPITRPDIDHLERAVLDALTRAGVWRDDSQVVEVSKVKTYPGEHPLALHVPGVAIHVTSIVDGDL